jgi:hypothetical protein
MNAAQLPGKERRIVTPERSELQRCLAKPGIPRALREVVKAPRSLRGSLSILSEANVQLPAQLLQPCWWNLGDGATFNPADSRVRSRTPSLNPLSHVRRSRVLVWLEDPEF